MRKFSSTTRASSRRTSQNKKYKIIAVVFVVACVGFFVVPKILSYTAALVLYPVHAVENWVLTSTASLPYYLRDRHALLNEMDELRLQLAMQSGERFTIELLSKENTELRALLGDSQEKRIVAGVIGRPNKVPYDVLILDKGQSDGIVVGAPVFINEDAVIGVVQEVFADSSVVELITSPGFTASVFIIGPNIYTNAVGVGGGQLRVGVPQGIALEEGNLVILPSASTGVYGEVSVIESVPSRPEQYGYVAPEIPISSLRLVSVGDAPLSPISFEEAQKVVEEAQKEMFMIPVPEGVLVTAFSSTTASSSTSTVQSATTTP